MGAMSNEPSMEDILSSIKRIIADGDRRPTARVSRIRPAETGRQEPRDSLHGHDDDFDMELQDDVPASDWHQHRDDLADDDAPVLELTERLPDRVVSAPARPTPPMERAAEDHDSGAADVAAPHSAHEETSMTDMATAPESPEPAGAAILSDPILSDQSAQAARASLSHLSAMLIRPEEGEANTLEALVREMLRPMLKDWMEAHLPDLVETMVRKEIDRIVGRLG